MPWILQVTEFGSTGNNSRICKISNLPVKPLTMYDTYFTYLLQRWAFLTSQLTRYHEPRMEKPHTHEKFLLQKFILSILFDVENISGIQRYDFLQIRIKMGKHCQKTDCGVYVLKKWVLTAERSSCTTAFEHRKG